MPKCDVTGIETFRGIFGIHCHHFIKQQHIKKDPQWFEDNGIHQKEFNLHYKLHDCIHHRSEKAFMEEYGEKYGIKRSDLLWNRKEWLNDPDNL